MKWGILTQSVRRELRIVSAMKGKTIPSWELKSFITLMVIIRQESAGTKCQPKSPFKRFGLTAIVIRLHLRCENISILHWNQWDFSPKIFHAQHSNSKNHLSSSTSAYYCVFGSGSERESQRIIWWSTGITKSSTIFICRSMAKSSHWQPIACFYMFLI